MDGVEDEVNGGQELGQGEGLGEEAPALLLQLLLKGCVEEAARDHQDGQVLAESFELMGEVQAGAVGHVEIGDEEIDLGGAAEDLVGAVSVS